MSYAGKLKFPFAVLIGEDEIAAGAVALKNLATGEQTALPPEAAARVILEEVSRRNSGAVITGKKERPPCPEG